MSHPNPQNYHHLISALLTYPSQKTKILDSNRDLQDLGLVEEIEQVATKIEAKGSTEAAIYLKDLAASLKNTIATAVETVNPDRAENEFSFFTDRPFTKSRIWQKTIILSLLGLLALMLNQSERDIISDVTAELSETADETVKPANLAIEAILPVKTTSIQAVESYSISRNYTGNLVPHRSSELGFDSSGILRQIIVDRGDRVTKGTPLAYLDSRNLEAQKQELLAQRAQESARLQEMQAGPRVETIAAAEAQVRNWTRQLELAKTQKQRRQFLYQEGAISREQLDEVASEVSVLQASLDEAQSNLDELKAGTRPEQIAAQQALIRQRDASIANLDFNLEKTILKAPFTGTISARLADEGTVVGAGQSLLRLVENDLTEAQIGVPVTVASKLKPGDSLPLQIGQKTYTATVFSLLPELDADTRTVTVILRLDRTAIAETVPGQIARLKIAEEIPVTGYWLPTTALVKSSRGLWSTYVLGQSNLVSGTESEPINSFEVERRDVEILYTDSDRVLVRGTLQPDEKVIIEGTHRLVSGQLVRLAE